METEQMCFACQFQLRTWKWWPQRILEAAPNALRRIPWSGTQEVNHSNKQLSWLCAFILARGLLSDSGGKAGEAWSTQNIPQLDFQKGSLLRPQGCMMMFSRVTCEPHSLTSTVGPGSSGSKKKGNWETLEVLATLDTLAPWAPAHLLCWKRKLSTLLGTARDHHTVHLPSIHERLLLTCLYGPNLGTPKLEWRIPKNAAKAGFVSLSSNV